MNISEDAFNSSITNKFLKKVDKKLYFDSVPRGYRKGHVVSWEGHRFCFAKAHLSALLGNRKTLFFYFTRFLERTNPLLGFQVASRLVQEIKKNPTGSFLFLGELGGARTLDTGLKRPVL